MKRNVRTLLTILLALAFVASGIWMTGYFAQYALARRQNDSAQIMAGLQEQTPAAPVEEILPEPIPAAIAPQPEPEPIPEPADEPEPEPEAAPRPAAEPVVDAYAPDLAQTDLAALQQINPEVIGWISIPETMLSYPLMQGEDNQYYLKHTWKKDYSNLGSLYMDYRNDSSLADFNTILYGHRMRGDDMFGSLKYYDEQTHWESHPAVYIATDEGVRRYDIFAAYEIDITNCHTYRLGLDETEGQQAYIDYCTGLSVLETGIVPEPGDHILTMSTCTSRGGSSDYRWIVQAVYNPET